MLQRKPRKEPTTGRADLHLATLESSSVVAAIAVAADGTILAANGRMRRFLGLSEGDGRKAERFGDYLVDGSGWTAWCEAARASRAIEI